MRSPLARGGGETHHLRIDNRNRYVVFKIPQSVPARDRVAEIKTDSNRGIGQDGTILDHRTAVHTAIPFNVGEASNQSIRFHFGCTTDVSGCDDSCTSVNFAAIVDPNTWPYLFPRCAGLAVSTKNIGCESPHIPRMKQAGDILPNEIAGSTVLVHIFCENYQIAWLLFRTVHHPQIQTSAAVKGPGDRLPRLSVEAEEVEKVGLGVSICRVEKRVSDSPLGIVGQLLRDSDGHIRHYPYLN